MARVLSPYRCDGQRGHVHGKATAAMQQLPLLDPRPRSALSRLTVALALLLGAALLWAVLAELRFQRRTTERVSEDYLALLANERLDAASASIRTLFASALGPQVSGTMGSVYDEVPPPAPTGAGVGALANSLHCSNQDAPTPSYFRIDLRNNGFLASPVASATETRWVQDAVIRQMQTEGPLPSGRFRTLIANRAAVVYAVKYAPYDAPVAVYGLITCPRAIATVLDAALAGPRIDSAISVLAVSGTDTIAGHAIANAHALATSRMAGIQLMAYPAFAQPLAGIAIERDVVPPLALTLMLLGTIALASIAAAQLLRDRHAVRRQADLIMTVSHELRTPLAQILLYSETLALDRVRGDDARRAAAQRIVEAAQHLSETVSNVVGPTRSGTTANPVTPVGPVIEAAITGVRALSDARAKVVVTVVGTPRVALGDSALLQTLTNVLDNALKFGPGAQTVLVSAERDRSVVRITVTDEGSGIPFAQRDRIWTKYFRANDAPDSAGTGIGLWVVRDIVVRAGGRVWADNVETGGARIVIELPSAEDP